MSAASDFSWRTHPGDDELRAGRYAADAIDQHESGWCGCCYLVAAAQMIRDRVHIALSKTTSEPRIPRADIQQLLERFDGWHSEPGWSACHGGFPEHVLTCMREEERCRHFLSSSPPTKLQGWVRHLEVLLPPPPPEEPILFQVGETRRIPEHQVRQVIRAEGPLVLEVSGKTLLDVDASGVVTDLTPRPIDHAVCVVGWRTLEDGRCAWILRNSWGATRAPTRFPDEGFLCGTERGMHAECDAGWKPWHGTPEDPGFVLLPCSYAPLHRLVPRSPWMTTSVVVHR